MDSIRVGTSWLYHLTLTVKLYCFEVIRSHNILLIYLFTHDEKQETMYRTKEIRWFFQEKKELLAHWFQHLNCTSKRLRTDFYLDINNEDIGIKLREGKIEVKHRVGTRGYGGLNDNIWGCFDEFIKWSFNVQEQDSVFSRITDFKHCNWIPVQKELMLVQLTEENGAIKPVSITEHLPFGCQVEYATVKVYGEVWYTFALEWFGEESLKVDGTIFAEMIDSINLHIDDSFGYAHFLTKLCSIKSNGFPVRTEPIRK